MVCAANVRIPSSQMCDALLQQIDGAKTIRPLENRYRTLNHKQAGQEPHYAMQEKAFLS